MWKTHRISDWISDRISVEPKQRVQTFAIWTAFIEMAWKPFQPQGLICAVLPTALPNRWAPLSLSYLRIIMTATLVVRGMVVTKFCFICLHYLCICLIFVLLLFLSLSSTCEQPAALPPNCLWTIPWSTTGPLIRGSKTDLYLLQ